MSTRRWQTEGTSAPYTTQEEVAELALDEGRQAVAAWSGFAMSGPPASTAIASAAACAPAIVVKYGILRSSAVRRIENESRSAGASGCGVRHVGGDRAVASASGGGA